MDITISALVRGRQQDLFRFVCNLEAKEIFRI